MKIDFLKIKAGFLPPKGKKQGFDSYIASMERLVKEMIPEDLFETEIAPPHFLSYETYFQKLGESLPIVTWSSIDEAPCTLSTAILCSAEFTHGTGRFFCDMMARHLIPGKQIQITVIRSLNFRFIIHPKDHYFITEIYIGIENERDLYQIQSHLPRLAEEIRLTLLATQHARKLVLSKPLTLDEKRMVLIENLSSLVKRPEEEFDHSILEDTHHLLLKVTNKEKPGHVPDHLLPLIEEKPQAFDHNMFQEIQRLISMFGKEMISKRDVHHLYRVLSYLYLFQKVTTHKHKIDINERFVSVKVLRTTVKPDLPVLAILICINFLKETEALNDTELIQTIQNHLPESQIVEESLVKIKSDSDQIDTIYLEMKRNHQASFTQGEVKELKKKLPKEIHGLIRQTLAELPHDQNEEEVMRNILTLSKQIKTPQDASPAIIHFSSETDEAVTFTAILVCLHAPKNLSLYAAQTPYLKILSHQTKIAGILNKRHLQNAHILKLKLDKGPYFSLYEARKTILTFLKENFGPVRDFNSGMIVKQYENLSELKAHVPPTDLVEKYFYSLTPGYKQSLLPSETLKQHYEMLTQSLHASFEEHSYAFSSENTQDELLLMISSPHDDLIEQIKQETASLISSSTDLTISDITSNDIRALGLIFSAEDPNLRSEFFRQIASLIKSLDPQLTPAL